MREQKAGLSYLTGIEVLLLGRLSRQEAMTFERKKPGPIEIQMFGHSQIPLATPVFGSAEPDEAIQMHCEELDIFLFLVVISQKKLRSI